MPYPKIGKILFNSKRGNRQKNAISKFNKTIGTKMRLHLITLLNPNLLAVAHARIKNRTIKQIDAFSKYTSFSISVKLRSKVPEIIRKYTIKIEPIIVLKIFPPKNSLISKMSLLPNGFHSFNIINKNKKTKAITSIRLSGVEEPHSSNRFCGRFNTI